MEMGIMSLSDSHGQRKVIHLPDQMVLDCDASV